MANILITAGGTGGHIFPGIALAKSLLQQGHKVHWLGTKNGLESRIVPKHGIPLHRITAGYTRGKTIWSKLLVWSKIIISIIHTVYIFIKIRPKLVIGFGGYVAFPGGIVSILMRIPMILHEQNAVIGKTNKLLMPYAKKLFFGSPIKSSIDNFIGNPVRQELHNIEKLENREQLRILVIGGSRGAQILNEKIPEVLANLNNLNIVVKHQLGQGKRSYYHKEQEQVEAVEFIDDMRSAYAWADLCICRAGALTISELIATQTPCILVPYPHAADNHQLANAKLIEDLGAGFIAIQDQELSNNITSIIEEILADTDKLKKMQQRFKPYQTPNAIVHLQSYIEGLLNA